MHYICYIEFTDSDSRRLARVCLYSLNSAYQNLQRLRAVCAATARLLLAFCPFGIAPNDVRHSARSTSFSGKNTLRNAECRPRIFCGMWDAENTCGMRYNLRNGKMRKSHLTLLGPYIVIATIYIHNTTVGLSTVQTNATRRMECIIHLN